MALERVLGLAGRVPGEAPADLRAYLAQRGYDPEAPLPLNAVFGPGASEDRVFASLAPGHPTARLERQNFVLVTTKNPPVPGCNAITAIAVATAADGTPLGYHIHTFLRDCAGRALDYLDYMVVRTDDPRAQRLGDRMCLAMRTAARAQKSTVGLLKTAWIGRYVWAMRGYDFADAKERDALTKKLAAYLTHHGVAESELVFDRGDGTTEPFAWDKLVHSWDFAQLRAHNRKVKVEVLVGAKETQALDLELGRAFLLGDWRTDGDGEHPHFTRNWNGAFDYAASSPSEQQLRRYEARRGSASTA